MERGRKRQLRSLTRTPVKEENVLSIKEDAGKCGP